MTVKILFVAIHLHITITSLKRKRERTAAILPLKIFLVGPKIHVIQKRTFFILYTYLNQNKKKRIDLLSHTFTQPKLDLQKYES
jgi:hypothetical protein